MELLSSMENSCAEGECRDANGLHNMETGLVVFGPNVKESAVKDMSRLVVGLKLVPNNLNGSGSSLIGLDLAQNGRLGFEVCGPGPSNFLELAVKSKPSSSLVGVNENILVINEDSNRQSGVILGRKKKSWEEILGIAQDEPPLKPCGRRKKEDEAGGV